MAVADIKNFTAERLNAYYNFSPETIDIVSSFAEKQATYATYQDFFEDIGIPEPTLFTMKNGTGVPVVDIKPKTQPVNGTLVVHLPMGNPLDTNQLYQLATIAGVNPSYRIIAFGNPAGGKYNFKEQDLERQQLREISSGRTIKPLITAELEYLQSQGIKDSYQIGYSYGALKALLFGVFRPINTVKKIILLEPVSHKRSLLRLAINFAMTYRPMRGYVEAPQLATFIESRSPEPSIKEIVEGLLRPINIATARLLAKSDLSTMIQKFFNNQPSALLTMAWGSKSELSNDIKMNVIAQKYHAHTLRLIGQKHALGNDIHLHAAIIYEALSRSTN